MGEDCGWLLFVAVECLGLLITHAWLHLLDLLPLLLTPAMALYEAL